MNCCELVEPTQHLSFPVQIGSYLTVTRESEATENVVMVTPVRSYDPHYERSIKLSINCKVSILYL